MKHADVARDDFNREMGRRIKHHRIQEGLSLWELATSIDISVRHLIRIEAGEIGTCAFLAWKICQDLEININEIMPSKAYAT